VVIPELAESDRVLIASSIAMVMVYLLYSSLIKPPAIINSYSFSIGLIEAVGTMSSTASITMPRVISKLKGGNLVLLIMDFP